MKDVASIIKRNVFQPIVIGVFILAVTLLFLGERSDAWFVSSVIAINTIFAIIQELRARRALKKLELMSAPRARRINKDGTVSELIFSELMVGDKIDIRDSR
jgi:magnesium-transporting ATPase (P-type)